MYDKHRLFEAQEQAVLQKLTMQKDWIELNNILIGNMGRSTGLSFMSVKGCINEWVSSGRLDVRVENGKVLIKL